MKADINTIEVGDKLEIEGTDEQTGKTSTRTVTIRRINTEQNKLFLTDGEGNEVAYIKFYLGEDAHLRAMCGTLIARLNSMEIVSRQPRDVDFDELESCVNEIVMPTWDEVGRGEYTIYRRIPTDNDDKQLVTDGGVDVEETMAKESFGLNKILDELRDVHGEPVAEDENMVVFADTHGHELGEIEAHTDGVNYDDVSQWMHKMARKLHDRDRTGGDAWSVADPVVVLKWNAGENPHLQNVKEDL